MGTLGDSDKEYEPGQATAYTESPRAVPNLFLLLLLQAHISIGETSHYRQNYTFPFSADSVYRQIEKNVNYRQKYIIVTSAESQHPLYLTNAGYIVFALHFLV